MTPANDNFHFSSKTDLWATPQNFFDKYNAVYGFTLDVCALAENAKCANYFTQDGLSQKWFGVCRMNPPYGRTIGKWVRHGAQMHAPVAFEPTTTYVHW